MLRVLACSGALCLAVSAAAAPSNPADYFPLTDGARWTYAVDGSGSSTFAVQPGVVDVGGAATRELRIVSGIDAGWSSFYSNSNGILLHREYDPSENATIDYSPPVVLVANPFDLGSSSGAFGDVTVSRPGLGSLTGTYGYTWLITARGAMNTPAGFYCDAVRRDGQLTVGIDGDVYSTTFVTYVVRGIGIVSESGEDDGPFSSILTSTTLPQPPTDRDCDGFADVADLCPHHASPSTADTDGDGRGDVCECGDQNGDGRNTVSDIVAINLAIFNPPLVTPLCDANGDGQCSVGDIVAVNIEIFSSTNTSTCARQPVPGP